MERTFYTYLWLREDGTPYYVGKGCGYRAYINGKHRFKSPEDDRRIIVQKFESEEDAFFSEKFLIDFYGRKDLGTGCLRNLTDGGEGMSGAIVSERTPETRAAMSAAGLKHWADPEYREKMTEKRIEQGKVSRGRKRQRKTPRKTHCSKGHERTPENLYKSRVCKICQKEYNALRYTRL